MEEIRIARDDAGQRLDRFLRKYLTGATLPTVFKLIRTRQVTVNGAKSRPEVRLVEGDRLVLYPGEGRLGDLRRKEGPVRPAPAERIDVLFEDEDLLAVAKPAFLLVHPGREGGGEATLLDAVLARAGRGTSKTFRPALAHRLDRLTSGVVLVGRSAEGLRGLTRALSAGEIRKVYLALVRGETADSGEIEAALRKEELFGADRPRMSVGGRGGKTATTLYRTMARSRGLSLLAVRPRTGRTHQIRAHLAHVGHPVAGDPTYGDRALNRTLRGRHGLWRQWLHALAVVLRHPRTGEELRIVAPVPGDLLRVLEGEGFPPLPAPDRLPEVSGRYREVAERSDP
jgi:23S rRNA pseudouridine955/2504/2580 synthase